MSARQLFQNVLVRSPQELKLIPGYSPDIDLADEKFVEVISHYYFRDAYQCALNGCRTWHKEGYVCIFESGVIGNVGCVCARKWIGVSFDEGLNRYQREIATPQLMSRLATAKADLPERVRQCDTLRQESVDFVTFKNGFRSAFPVIWSELTASQNTLNYAVMQSKEVVEIVEDEGGTVSHRSKIVSERVGAITGIRALRENVMPLINNIQSDLKKISGSGGSQELTWVELNDLVAIASNIDEKLSHVHALVQQSQSFRTPENERLIRRLQGRLELEKEAGNFSFSMIEQATSAQPNASPKPAASKFSNRKSRRRMKFQNQSILR